MVRLFLPYHQNGATLDAEPPRATLEQLVARANEYAEDRRAGATPRAYLTDFRSFEAWCAAHTLASMPASPATVAVYLVALAG